MPSLLDWLRPSTVTDDVPTTNSNFTFSIAANPNSAVEVTPENAMTNATVFTCLSVLGTAVSQLPVAVMKEGDKSFSPVKHYVNDLLKKPNASQSQYEFLYGIVVDLMLYGNCYIQKITTSSGKVIELVPLPANEVETVLSISGKRTFILNKKVYTEKEIIHLRDFVGQEAQGLSRVKQTARLVAIDNAIDVLIADTFVNGTSASGIVSFPDDVEPATAQAFTDAWSRKFGKGGTTRGSVAVIGGGATFQQLSPLSPADGDIQSLKEQTTARIGAVFRIPSHMLEIFSGAKYSNVQVRNTAFYRDSIAPLTTLIEQKLTFGLLGDSGLTIRFDAADLLRGDLQQATTVAVDAVGAGLLSVDEARALMGYSPMAEEDKPKPPQQIPTQEEVQEDVDDS
jgi:HK97 family phage portal protein